MNRVRDLKAGGGPFMKPNRCIAVDLSGKARRTWNPDTSTSSSSVPSTPRLANCTLTDSIFCSDYLVVLLVPENWRVSHYPLSHSM